MEDKNEQKSVVELPPPDWMQRKSSADTNSTRPDDSTGVEDVSADSTVQRPRNLASVQDVLNENLAPRESDADFETYVPGMSFAPRQRAKGNGTFGNMQDVIDFLEERKAAIHLPTKDELEKERRRKRTEGIISAIADGASALSNLIFTTQYAPDMYRHEDSLSEKMRQRYERLKKERDADADRYLNYALTIGRLKDAQEAKEYQRGRDALQDQQRLSQETRAQLKADRDAAMAELKMELMAGRISQQDAAARAKEIEAEYADEYWNARVDELKSRKRKNDRWQPSGSRSGGGGSKGRHPWRDDKGVFGKPGEVRYESSESGAREMAATHGGTYMTTPSTTTTTKPDKLGDLRTTTTVKDTSTPKVTIDWN